MWLLTFWKSAFAVQLINSCYFQIKTTPHKAFYQRAEQEIAFSVLIILITDRLLDPSFALFLMLEAIPQRHLHPLLLIWRPCLTCNKIKQSPPLPAWVTLIHLGYNSWIMDFFVLGVEIAESLSTYATVRIFFCWKDFFLFYILFLSSCFYFSYFLKQLSQLCTWCLFPLADFQRVMGRRNEFFSCGKGHLGCVYANKLRIRRGCMYEIVHFMWYLTGMDFSCTTSPVIANNVWVQLRG